MNELHKSSGLDVGECYSTNVNNCVEFASAIAGPYQGFIRCNGFTPDEALVGTRRCPVW